MTRRLSFAGMALWAAVLCGPSVLWAQGTGGESGATEAEGRYERREEHHPDGIGKFYMGREIAHVMGHRGASWLERPEREEEERPDLLLQALDLEKGMTVADIGAGSGYFSRRLAREVGDEGKVLAVDIQPEMIELLKANLKEEGIENVSTILSAEQDPKLPPNSVDLVLMVDVYHEFSYPHEMLAAIVKSLKPGGRVAFVEYRLEDPAIPIKKLHKMSEAQVRKEASVHPLEWVKTARNLPRQHVVIFRKKPRDA